VDDIVLDDALRDRLVAAGDSVELRDQAGQTVGYFLSPDEYKRLIYAWAREEFAREEREHPYDDSDEGSMTTPELLAYLEQLGRESGAA
jgi:hypothetical protein